MVKATVISKKCENEENNVSSADTIKPYNSVIHGHRFTQVVWLRWKEN